MSKEIWKDVPGYEGYYQASNLGRVRSLDRDVVFIDGRKRFFKGGIIDGGLNKTGYRQTTLTVNRKSKTFKFSQLVAMAFLNHETDGHNKVVDHINGDKSDDRLVNLRIVTNRDNCTTCFRVDRDSFSSTYIGVSWSNENLRWVARISYNGVYIHIGYFDDEVKASKAYQLALSKIKDSSFNPDNYKPKHTSKYKGVFFCKRSNRWVAQVGLNYKRKKLGYFTSECEAAQVYNNYVVKHGLERQLNNIQQ